MRLIVTLATTLLIFSCHKTYEYEGDGEFMDNGPSAANNRFVISFGEINLDTTNKYTFNINSLPDAEFTIGIDVKYDEPLPEKETQRINALIELKILDSNQNTIVYTKSSLETWAWSMSTSSPRLAYAYDRINNYFEPASSKYLVSLVVLSPNTTTPKHKTNLVLKSGGWK